MKYRFFSYIIFILTFMHNSYAESTQADRDLQMWFESDEEISTEHINEGELKFLNPPLKPSLHSINRIFISQQSLTTGWVILEQCYEQLDPVPVTEIIYQYKHIRNLRITTQQNIESSTLDKKSVQLENIGKKAKLCIKADVKILNRHDNGSYSLVNGPFHRQFLHGYYPYHLSLQVNYPSSTLTLVSTTPENQKGFMVKKTLDMLHIESHFEGMLTIKLLFQQIAADT